MQNGHAGNAPISINPVQAAQFALMFLARADFKAPEREAYAIAEGFLTAIVKGNVAVVPAPPAMQDASASAPAASAGGTD